MKGYGVNIRVVGAVLLALIVVIVLLGGFNDINSSAEDQANKTNQDVQDETEEASCVAECRRDFPSGGLAFEDCKQNRGCD